MACRYDLPQEVLDTQEEMAARLNARRSSPVDFNCELLPHPEIAKRDSKVSVLRASDNEDVRVFYDAVSKEWCVYDG